MEVHMPYHKAKTAFQNSTLWMWPKFDKRPVGFLIFMEDFPPCIWYPDRQEGMTFRWVLPPLFCERGPIVCLANLLPSESVLQIEDLIIDQGNPIWSSLTFSKRWEKLSELWNRIPTEQPLLAFTPRIVTPIPLEEWPHHYDFAIYWIIQSDHAGQPRWFWKDVVTVHTTPTYVAPQLKRNTEVMSTLCAYCSPYTKMVLPDIYSLQSQEGGSLGLAAITSLQLSQSLRSSFSSSNSPQGIPVEVTWNDSFKKYQIHKILPIDTPITTQSFFHHLQSSA
jgi:hypothetical protein